MKHFTTEQTQKPAPQVAFHNFQEIVKGRPKIEKILNHELIFTNPHECLRQKRVKNCKGLYEQEAFLVPFSKVRKHLLASTRSSSQKQTMYVNLEFNAIEDVVKVLSRILPKHSNLRGLSLIFGEEITFDSWSKIGSLISRFSHLKSLKVQFLMKKPRMDDHKLAKMHRSISMLPGLTCLGIVAGQTEANLARSGIIKAAFLPDDGHNTEGFLYNFITLFKKLNEMHFKNMGQDCMTDPMIVELGKALSELPKLQYVSLKMHDCRGITGQGFNTALDYVQTNPQVKKLSIALNIEDGADTQNLPVCHPIWTNKNLEYGSLEAKLSSLSLPKTLESVLSGVEKMNCLGRLVLNFNGIFWEAVKGITEIAIVLPKLPCLTDLTIRFLNCHTLDSATANNLIYGLNSCSGLKKADLEFLSCLMKVEEAIPEIGGPLVNRPNLKELAISCVDCGTVQEKQVDRIAELIANCMNLEALALQITWSQNLLDQQYQKLMKSLSDMVLLKRLTWGFEGSNQITRNSGMPCGKMITRLTQLRFTDINLSYFSEMEDERMGLVGGWFSELKHLEALKLNLKGCNRVSNEGIKAFCLNLKGLRKLGTITLVWNTTNVKDLSQMLVGKLAANLPNLYYIEFQAVKKNGQISKVGIRLSP